MNTFTALLFTLGVTEPSRPARLAGRAVGKARGGDDGDVVAAGDDGAGLQSFVGQTYRAGVVVLHTVLSLRTASWTLLQPAVTGAAPNGSFGLQNVLHPS